MRLSGGDSIVCNGSKGQWNVMEEEPGAYKIRIAMSLVYQASSTYGRCHTNDFSSTYMGTVKAIAIP
jgi:hypothetical protein